jgi:hypothetical protein
MWGRVTGTSAMLARGRHAGQGSRVDVLHGRMAKSALATQMAYANDQFRLQPSGAAFAKRRDRSTVGAQPCQPIA